MSFTEMLGIMPTPTPTSNAVGQHRLHGNSTLPEGLQTCNQSRMIPHNGLRKPLDQNNSQTLTDAAPHRSLQASSPALAAAMKASDIETQRPKPHTKLNPATSGRSGAGAGEDQLFAVRFCCKLCDRTFEHKAAAGRHSRFHTEGSTNCCHICEQKFSCSATLQNHMKLHSGEKSFACQTCGRSFRLKSYLDVHIRTHTKERPYKCETCEKGFTQRGALAAHRKIHAGLKPHVCEVCFKAFTLKNYLVVHMRVHTGEKPFVCGMCNKSYSQKSSLTNHCQKHTPESWRQYDPQLGFPTRGGRNRLTELNSD